MLGLNKVMVIGNLGRDPECRSTQSGTAVANLSVAANETWKDKNGEKQERTEWVRCVLWGKLADVAEKYLHKGDAIFIEGKLQTRTWEDRNGEKKYTTEVNVHELRMLGGNGSSGGGRPRDSQANNAVRDDEPPPIEEEDNVPF